MDAFRSVFPSSSSTSSSSISKVLKRRSIIPSTKNPGVESIDLTLTPKSRTSLSDFPNELLDLICQLATEANGLQVDFENHTQATHHIVPSRLDGLSRASRRMRDVCRPYLFKHIAIVLGRNFVIEELRRVVNEVAVVENIRSMAIYAPREPKTPVREVETPPFSFWSRLKPHQVPQIMEISEPMEREFPALWTIICSTPRLRSLTVLIAEKPISTAFASAFSIADQHNLPLSNAVHLEKLEELTVGVDTLWALNLCNRRNKDGKRNSPRLKTLRLLHPETMDLLKFDDQLGWLYRSLTDRFTHCLEDLGYKDDCPIKELKLVRMLNVTDMKSYSFTYAAILIKLRNLEILDYWVEWDPHSPTTKSTCWPYSPIAFSVLMQAMPGTQAARIQSIASPPDTQAIMNNVYTTVKALRLVCRQLKEVRVMGLTKAIINEEDNVIDVRVRLSSHGEELFQRFEGI